MNTPELAKILLSQPALINRTRLHESLGAEGFQQVLGLGWITPEPDSGMLSIAPRYRTTIEEEAAKIPAEPITESETPARAFFGDRSAPRTIVFNSGS